jgi:hypothetical protein
MAKKQFGQLPPRYTFALNPYPNARFSKCPKCGRATYPRKFPLLIHVDKAGPFVLGKTCKYCSKCEFIITHQDELESTLAAIFAEREPTVMGNDYFVLGTVDKKAWRQRLDHEGTIDEILPYTADIKEYATLEYEPARWVFDDES